MPTNLKHHIETKPTVTIEFPNALPDPAAAGSFLKLTVTFEDVVSAGYTTLYEVTNVADIDGMVVKRGKGFKEINTDNINVGPPGYPCTGTMLLIETDAEIRGRVSFKLPLAGPYVEIRQAVNVRDHKAKWSKPLPKDPVSGEFFTTAPLNCLFCIT